MMENLMTTTGCTVRAHSAPITTKLDQPQISAHRRHRQQDRIRHRLPDAPGNRTE